MLRADSFTGLLRTTVDRLCRPLSEGQLAALEAGLGVALPNGLRALYRLTSSGMFRLRYMTTEEHEYEINAHPSASRALGELRAELVGRGVLSSDLVPFARGSGGDFYCVAPPSEQILFVPLDPPSDHPRIVAATMGDFLRELTSEL